MKVGDKVICTNPAVPNYGDLYTVKRIFNGYADVGINNSNNVYRFLMEDLKVHEEDSVEQVSTIDRIKTFTMNHKDIEISFEDGMIVVRNWDIRFKEPVDYHVDTIEQLEEFMDAFEVMMKFCKKEDV